MSRPVGFDQGVNPQMPRCATRPKMAVVEKQNILSARATMSIRDISGIVDTLGFIALFGLFPPTSPATFVLLAASFVDYRSGLLLKLLAIPAFIAAAIATRLYMIHHERRARDASAHILIAEAALLAVFMAVALAAAPFDSQDMRRRSPPACWPPPPWRSRIRPPALSSTACRRPPS